MGMMMDYDQAVPVHCQMTSQTSTTVTGQAVRIHDSRPLAKALDRGKGQNWQTLRMKFGMKTSPRGEAAIWSFLKEDEQRFPDLILLSPLGPFVLAIYAQLQHPVGLGRLGRHNDDRESRAPPWPPLKPAATEVGCGIELSPCSAACPSGTIYTSFRPDIGAGLLSGTVLQWRESGTPQIQQVYSAMDPLVAYTLAPMHLPAFNIPRDSGKTTWEGASVLLSFNRNTLFLC
ncbi:hypothetical protein THAOC_03356 [Thalassiosira oceanica]|uniref:Uncharacterized protein n=1 Tax=Thalassiosira oceanica TaxID=159749 RepID=K0TCL9_THAOC|nr:hypothetical protein THAOC_03356 [Thalassiosira oceanica]|eukprot:EJK74939.1 hypothetical protein THAOC_03356 [Thalassiosira oceanica]